MNHSQKIELLEEVGAIESRLSKKYDAHIRLNVSIYKRSIDQIYYATNEAFRLKYPNRKHLDIKVKTSLMEYVLFRRMFMFIAAECNFTRQEIGQYMDQDHSSVTASVHSMRYLIETKKPHALNEYNNIKKILGI